MRVMLPFTIVDKKQSPKQTKKNGIVNQQVEWNFYHRKITNQSMVLSHQHDSIQEG